MQLHTIAAKFKWTLFICLVFFPSLQFAFYTNQLVNMSTVLLFGSFDILHDGHRHLFAQASKYGELHVILARDTTIEQVKKRLPFHNEEERLVQLQKEPLIKQVYLGSLADKFQKIQELKPDVIFLGYDQEVFVDTLYKKIEEFALQTEVIRGVPYREEECKSSLLRAQREANR